MALIEGNGRIRKTIVPESPGRKNAIPKKTNAENAALPTGSNNSVAIKRAEYDQQAGISRFRLQRDFQAEYDGAGEGDPTTQTPEERARAAAQEVADAYNAHPNVIISTPGNGRDPNEPWAQEAAAQRLREVTENEPPEVVALIIEYSKPTLDLIGSELRRTAGQYDGSYGDSKPDFDNVVNDLAIVAGRAAQSPNGSEAVSLVAETIV